MIWIQVLFHPHSFMEIRSVSELNLHHSRCKRLTYRSTRDTLVEIYSFESTEAWNTLISCLIAELLPQEFYLHSRFCRTVERSYWIQYSKHKRGTNNSRFRTRFLQHTNVIWLIFRTNLEIFPKLLQLTSRVQHICFLFVELPNSAHDYSALT